MCSHRKEIHPAVWLIQTAGKNAQINYAYTHAHCMLCMWVLLSRKGNKGVQIRPK